jgi:hypothetical protein
MAAASAGPEWVESGIAPQERGTPLRRRSGVSVAGATDPAVIPAGAELEVT